MDEARDKENIEREKFFKGQVLLFRIIIMQRYAFNNES